MAYSMGEEKEFYAESTLGTEWDFTCDDMGKGTTKTPEAGAERPNSRVEGLSG